MARSTRLLLGLYYLAALVLVVSSVDQTLLAADPLARGLIGQIIVAGGFACCAGAVIWQHRRILNLIALLWNGFVCLAFVAVAVSGVIWSKSRLLDSVMFPLVAFLGVVLPTIACVLFLGQLRRDNWAPGFESGSSTPLVKQRKRFRLGTTGTVAIAFSIFLVAGALWAVDRITMYKARADASETLLALNLAQQDLVATSQIVEQCKSTELTQEQRTSLLRSFAKMLDLYRHSYALVASASMDHTLRGRAILNVYRLLAPDHVEAALVHPTAEHWRSQCGTN